MANICKIDNCGGKVFGHGWCGKHYNRWRTHGDPLTIHRQEPGTPLEDKIKYFGWTETLTRIPLSPCHLWNARLDTSGYPMVKHMGKQVRVTRHVLSEKLGRPLREKHSALHVCDQPACINPDHLFEGTQQENILDMHAKGRNRVNRGFNDDQIRQIRKIYDPALRNMQQVANMFSTDTGTISRIVNKVLYKSVRD